jgi:pantoate--beta-alanine ligase
VRAVATSAELRAATGAARDDGTEVGFVPTMGALHAGHRSLVARARRETGFVVVSVFVNPLQFGPSEDLATYPRDREGDLAALRADGVDLAFLPAEEELWPVPPGVRLCVGPLASRLEGALRPGHFDGVATVVAKLLHLVGPARAYFGQKDAQQLAVVRRMVADLAFPNRVVACPTVREADGLAMSSRNAHLSAGERERATALSRAVLDAAAGVEVQYVALVEPDGFTRPAAAAPGHLLAAAARVGSTRLIDNVTLD